MRKQKILSLAACIVAAPMAHTAETQDKPATNVAPMEEVVITGVTMEEPLVVETDPKLPRQPLPAPDGADYLKTFPGFSIIRKGGTGGDPIFRGMAGSRLTLLQDGGAILGGCGNRMDPPTAYIFPETYDRVRLIKGPQTVLYGPGNSSGVVLFERAHEPLPESGWRLYGSVLGGSFGRNDEVLDIEGRTSDLYLRGLGSYSQQDNYHEGDGDEIHSQYERWNSTVLLGWIPTDKLTLELSGSRSDAEASYADRGMDGIQFAQDKLSMKLVVQDLGPKWQTLEAQVFHTNIDHVMDSYSLRELGAMAMPMVYNPERVTLGGRVFASFTPFISTQLDVGLDAQKNDHNERQTMNQNMMPYQHLPRMDDADFAQFGVFGEWTQKLTERRRVIGGLRVDDWRVQDRRDTITPGMMDGMMMDDMMPMPNPSAGETREETLSSGFLRYEHDRQLTKLYAGIGRSERFPDYWELISKESLTTVSAFHSKSETTTQLDVGAIYETERVKGSVSVFYNKIDNFLLIQSGVEKPMGMMGTRNATVTRNIDARSWGLEMDLRYAFNHHWYTEASIAGVRGSNESDNAHLAQLPPLEMRLGLVYQNASWTGGALWRAVDDQSRVDPGKGNIAGQDIGPSDGFHVFSLNLTWQANESFQLSGGIDNVLNEVYAEHVSKSGVMVPGFDPTKRIHEPGRTFWLKLQLHMD